VRFLRPHTVWPSDWPGLLSPWDWTATDWAGVTCVVLIVAAFVAWRQVKEARKLREEQARPFIVIDFKPWSTIIELTITNYGKTLARDVKFDFVPALATTHDDTPGRGKIMDLNLFKNGIPSLAPSKEIKLFFDQFPARVAAELPMTYDVRISYRDTTDKAYSEVAVLDLSMYVGTGGITRHTIHDVHKRLEELVREVKKWTFFGGGIKTMSRKDIDEYYRELDEHRARLEQATETSGDVTPSSSMP
jgi:hypothetical protein